MLFDQIVQSIVSFLQYVVDDAMLCLDCQISGFQLCDAYHFICRKFGTILIIFCFGKFDIFLFRFFPICLRILISTSLYFFYELREVLYIRIFRFPATRLM